MTPELNHRAAPVQPHRGRRITAGKLTGQKPALKMKEVWAIRIRLQLSRKIRELALFNLAIDSKLQGCDLVCLRVKDVVAIGEVRSRAIVVQKKTGRPVQFEITEQTRIAIAKLSRERMTHVCFGSKLLGQGNERECPSSPKAIGGRANCRRNRLCPSGGSGKAGLFASSNRRGRRHGQRP
jgi:hypothetical protein